MNSDKSELKEKITQMVNETGGTNVIEIAGKLEISIKTTIELVKELDEEDRIRIQYR